MSVYVDEIWPRRWGHNGRLTGACHMIADSEAELYEMAFALGLRSNYVHLGRAGLAHFDLTPGLRKRAVERGALELDRAAFMAKIREARARAEAGVRRMT